MSTLNVISEVLSEHLRNSGEALPTAAVVSVDGRTDGQLATLPRAFLPPGEFCHTGCRTSHRIPSVPVMARVRRPPPSPSSKRAPVVVHRELAAGHCLPAALPACLAGRTCMGRTAPLHHRRWRSEERCPLAAALTSGGRRRRLLLPLCASSSSSSRFFFWSSSRGDFRDRARTSLASSASRTIAIRPGSEEEERRRRDTVSLCLSFSPLAFFCSDGAFAARNAFCGGVHGRTSAPSPPRPLSICPFFFLPL